MRLISGIIAITAAATPAASAEIVAVPAFQSVQLRGGGEVVVRHGPAQRVSLVQGSSGVSRFTVEERDGGRLVIDACQNRCPRNYKLRVEIVTPTLAGLAINGGGRMTAIGAFPQQRSLALAIRGGGVIDARPVRAGAVSTAINGGGLISTHAVQTLAAAINGGGSVRYWGDPRKTVNINGGGAVAPADGGVR
jgi:hypothetical protein